MATRIYYSISITDSNTRCDGWNTFTLTSHGGTVPANAVIVNAGWDVCTLCKSRYEGSGSPEFGIYGLAIRDGPYTGASYYSSAPSSLPYGSHVSMSHTASESDYMWGYPEWRQGGEVWIKLANGTSWTHCDAYNNIFAHNQMFPGTGLINQSQISVKIKFGNTAGSATYAQNNDGNNAITVWVDYEIFSGSWSSGANLACSQNAFTITATRNGYYSVSHGSVKYMYFGANGRSSETTVASWSETLQESQLGDELSYSVIPYIYYGSNSTNGSALNRQITPSLPSLSWSAGAHIEFSEASNKMALITRDGSAADPNGFTGNVYYRLWCENTEKNTDGDSGSSWKISPTAYGRVLTYKLRAYFVISGTRYWSDQLTVSGIIEDNDTVKVYHFNRSKGQYEWVECIPMYCKRNTITGELEWVECIPYYYNGTRWVELSHS